MTRIYQNNSLSIGQTIQLDTEAAHHVARVLRSKVDDAISIFNGSGDEYAGKITHIDKKTVSVHLEKSSHPNVESSLELYLAQGISRGEKMDYTIQKAVELGVKKIFPLLTERCNVKIDNERKEKRWQSIIVSACEQSGRTQIPELYTPQSLTEFLRTQKAELQLVLAPTAEKTLSNITLPKNSSVILLIGPEGGLSADEITLANKNSFISLKLGPRILRTETAAVTALSLLQFYAGDFA